MWVYPEIRVLGDVLRFHSRVRPAQLAVVSNERSRTFAELDSDTNAVARSLLAAIPSGNARICYFGRNYVELAEVLFGAAKAGFAFMPLNWRLSPAEIAALIEDSGCAVMFVETGLASLIVDALQRTSHRPIVVHFDPAGATLLDGFAAEFSHEELAVDVPESVTGLMMYTSGTTGLPKGVELAHSAFNYMRLCEHLDEAACWKAGETFLMFMPNFHMAGVGWLIQSLYNGMTVSMLRQFDPKTVLAAIRDSRPSLMIIVPTALQMLLDHPEAAATDFTCFKLVVYAGSPMPYPLIVRALELMKCGFLNCYGATELLSTATWLRPDQHDLQNPERLHSIGTAVPLVEIRLLDSDGHEVPDGDVGEIVVRMPSVFKGYWRKPELSKAAVRDGWYFTGDAAVRDAQGFYFLKDRVKDMIVSGGENIYSSEIEQVLARHQAVVEAVVIGVPDERWGEAVKALVILREGTALGSEELIGFCRQHIAGYKTPKTVEFVTDFPRTPSGKVQKAKLRAQFRR